MSAYADVDGDYLCILAYTYTYKYKDMCSSAC